MSSVYLCYHFYYFLSYRFSKNSRLICRRIKFAAHEGVQKVSDIGRDAGRQDVCATLPVSEALPVLVRPQLLVDN